MSTFKSIPLDVPTVAANTGNIRPIAEFSDNRVVFSGTWSGNYSIMISNSTSGDDFIAFGAAITANGFVPLPDSFARVAIRCNSYVSGTPVATWSGRAPN